MQQNGNTKQRSKRSKKTKESNSSRQSKQPKPFTKMPARTWSAPDSASTLIPRDDPRRTLLSQNLIALPGSRSAITVDTSYDGATLIQVVMGYISAALQKGYLANAPDPNYPFWAANYILDILNSYVKGTVPAASQLPTWLHCLGRALAPKEVPSAHHGLADYKVSYDQLLFPSSGVVSISPSVYGYETLLLIPGSSTPVNGFPVAVPPLVYGVSVGEKAWNSVCQFMADILPDLTRQNSMVALSTKTEWDRNVSPMCVVTQTTGWGPSNSGGQDFQAQLEVPVHTPLLSVLNRPLPPNTQIQRARAATYSTKSAGTPMSLGAYLPGLIKRRHWNSKKAPHFKFIDFMEFADVLAIYVQKLQQERATSPTAQRTIVDPSVWRCPLTIQEMQILLRNEIMYVFGVSQSGAQGLMPRLPASANDNEFVAFAAGTTTCATSAMGMKLPKAFVENIKSLSHVCADIGRDGTKLKYSPTQYIPVLGKYAYDTLLTTDYNVNWIVNDLPLESPAFFVEPALTQKDQKGQWKPQLETPVDLIDGTAGSAYIFLNDVDRLSTLVSFWNEWIVTLEDVSSQLTTVTSDGGLRVIGSLFMTRHWGEQTQIATARHAEFKDERVMRRREISSTVYSNRSQYAISAGCKLVSGTDTFFRSWVLPVNPISRTDRPGCATDFVRMQFVGEEPVSSTTSTTGDDGRPLSDNHVNYATALVRGSASPKTEWDTLLDDLDQSGHAGVLSSLASAVGGAIFGPGVGAALGGVVGAFGG